LTVGKVIGSIGLDVGSLRVSSRKLKNPLILKKGKKSMISPGVLATLANCLLFYYIPI